MTYRRVVLDDPLDRLFKGGQAKLGLERKEQAGQDPSLNPPPTWRPLAGIRQNMRGNAIVVSPGTSEPNVLMSRSPGDDAEVCMVTLGLELEGVDPNTEVSGPNSIDITANLEWGIGNATFTADCDWRWGTTLQIPLNFLRIGATYAFNPNTGAGDNSFDVRLSASAAYGSASRNSNTARLTVPVTTGSGASRNLAMGSTSDPILIPNFATSVTLLQMFQQANLGASHPSAGAGGPFVLAQTGAVNPGATQCAHVFASASNRAWLDEGAIPIMGGARYVFVQNQSNVNVIGDTTGYAGLFLLFGLSL